MRRKQTQIVTQERAGLYVRVSLDRSAHGMQDEILSPETQEDRGRAYCQAQGWAIAAVERDIDESAYRHYYSHREGLMRLLEAIDRGEITRIVVWKFSRLSRRLKEFIEICDRVETRGGGVVSITEACDTSTSAGRLVRNILASFAQFQSEEISEQIFETWITMAKQGRRPGGLAPFGTLNNKGILEPDPAEHPHLLAMFQTFRKTGSVRAVWDYLNAHQIPAPKAAEWNVNTIRGILANPVYVGQLNWAGEVFQAKWAPLVPEDLWHEVQDTFAQRNVLPTKRKDARMLNGILRCESCGRPMWTRYAKRSTSERGSHLARVYWCCSPTNNRRGCDLPAVDAEEAETSVWETVQTILRSASVDHLVAAAARQRDARADGDAGRRRQQLQADKERTERDAGMLFDLLGDGSITREQFRQRNQLYIDRLQSINAELARIATPPAGPTPEIIRWAASAAKTASNDEERRRILASLGVQVVAGARGVHVDLLGLRMSLRARRVGETWHFGEIYQTLTFRGHTLTDKQERFIQRTYGWADKRQIAARLGRTYQNLIQVAQRLRRDGILENV